MKWQRSAARLLVVAVALMTVAGAMAPVGAAAANAPPEPPQRYFGTVTDGDSGVGGLTVQVEQDGEVVAEDVTDSDGYYDLQVNTSEVDTGEQVTVSVAERTKTVDVQVGGSTEVDFTVSGDTLAGGSAELGDDGTATVELSESGVSSARITLSGGVSGSVNVRVTSGPSGGSPAVSGQSVAAYLDIEVPNSATGGTVEVTVSQSALDDAGIAAENANVLHYEDGSWATLDTTLVGEASGDVTLRADVSSFSPFAIAGSSTGDGGGDTGDGGGGGQPGGGGGGAGGGGGGADTTTSTPTTSTTQEPTDTTSTPTTSTTQEPTDTPTTGDQQDPGTTADGPDDEGGGGLPVVPIAIVLVAAAGAAVLLLRYRE